MLDSGRDYISMTATGDNDADFARMQAIGDAILAAFGDTVAYRVMRLDDIECIEEELRDPEIILAASGGHLPVLLVNLTYPPDTLRQADLNPLETQFGLILVGDTADPPR